MSSYDDRQITAPLTLCQKCGRAFYMHAVLCALCGPGFRTVQTPPEPQTDVSGHAMNGGD